ncbi:hypothetical protein ACLX1H_004461 [Fusarium chlamydosporum]
MAEADQNIKFWNDYILLNKEKEATAKTNIKKGLENLASSGLVSNIKTVTLSLC